MKNQSEVKTTSNDLTEKEENSLFASDEQAEGLAETTDGGESYYDRIRREKSEETRQGRKLGKKEIILIIVLVAAVIGILIAVLSFNKEAGWDKVSSEAHQYALGSSSLVNSGTQLKTDSEGKIVVKDDANNGIISSPIYYDERDAFLLTEDMVYYDPRGDVRRCASALTEFYVDGYGQVYAVKDNVSKPLDMGFLYNGKDRYVFLEPMTLELNGYTVDLAPLSYVETTEDGDVNIFYYDTKEMETINCGGEAIAYPEGKIYTIELFSDAIIVPEGDRMLLFFAPEKLEALL